MSDGRGALVAWLAAVCGGSGALAAVPASGVGKGTWWHDPVLIVLTTIAAVTLVLLLAIGALPVWSWLRTRRLGRRPGRSRLPATPQPATTSFDRWRHTTDGMHAPALLHLQDAQLSHPAYNGRAPGSSGLPSVRIGVMVACDQLDPSTPPTPQLRASLLGFLSRPPVRDLIASLTHVGQGVAWRRWEGHGRMNLEAVLTTADEAAAPVAWARLLVPEPGMSHYGRDPQRAELILFIEPRTADGQCAPALTLLTWHERLVQALGLPTALADFLAEDLDLRTSQDPPALLGVCLLPEQAMAELVDSEGCGTVPGATPSTRFLGFAVADANGQPTAVAAQDFLRQLCDYTLKIDNYEQILGAISARTRHTPGKV